MQEGVDQWTSEINDKSKALMDLHGFLPKDLDYDIEEFCAVLGYFCENEEKVQTTRIVLENNNVKS